jgi:hypothetical protein
MRQRVVVAATVAVMKHVMSRRFEAGSLLDLMA